VAEIAGQSENIHHRKKCEFYPVLHSGKNLPKTLHFEKNKGFCVSGTEITESSIQTLSGKPKTFLRAIIRLFVEFLSVFGLFSGPKLNFSVIF
jgi:hypothetical protein